jgi:DNA-binding NarL/FixJ family response regulator
MLTGPDALTPSERRVAELAVQGLTTRQISEALYVSPKTVEFHLRHIYRKLDVSSSRTELARVLRREPVEHPSNAS